MTRNATMRDCIREAVAIPPDIARHIADLNANLMHGPSLGEYSRQTRDRVREWFDELPTLYFIDYVPEATASPDDSETDAREIDTATVAKALLGPYADYI